MNIVLIETSGNQRYIFVTNKLRENVGASELTYRVGTEAVLKAVDEEKGFTKDDERGLREINDLDGRKLRANLLNKTRNPELAKGGKIEIITATSGKALLLVEDENIGRSIIRKVTQEALRKMPGLTVHGAISEITFDDPEEKDDKNEFKIHQAISQVHRKHDEIRRRMPGNEQRFQRLPFVAPCATSGLPANKYYDKAPEPSPRSMVSIKKRESACGGEQRLEAVIQCVAKDVRTVSTEELEREFKDVDAGFRKGLSWVAVIHADGNGVGEIFSHFDVHTGLKSGKCTGREYVEKYRRFSLALDVCTINAAGFALEKFRQRFLAVERARNEKQGENSRPQRSDKRIPVVPLILGGDDLTVLCDGEYALKFVHDFLTRFEAETEKLSDEEYLRIDRNGKALTVEGATVFDLLKEIIPEIASKAFGVKRLGICAGVAIIKPHFPFHQAYELAEQLLKSAKQVKEKLKSKSTGKQHSSSALDYHILYDSTASRLEDIRDRMKSDGGKTHLFARPYVISELNDAESQIKDTNWFTPRKWNELDKRLAAMMKKNEDNKRELPNSQLHTLREALYLGKAETDARVNLIRHRYNKSDAEKVFDVLLWDKSEEKPTLFFPEDHEAVAGHATHFLDALDIVEFRKGEKEENGRIVDKGSNDGSTA